MDWQYVTVDELVSALREAEWNTPPRPLLEFAAPGKLSPPKSRAKWSSRLKNNLYYYRSNYLLALGLWAAAPLYRHLAALPALLLPLAALLSLNDSFAGLFNDSMLKVLKKIHPPSAARLRSRSIGGGLGPPGRDPRTDVRIVGVHRGVFGAVLGVLGALGLYYTHAVLATLAGCLLGVAFVLLHATLRQPNLKTRLASAREEFRAVWRNTQFHDLTL